MPAHAIPSPSSAAPEAAYTSPSLRIVVADDDPTICEYLKESLTRLGHRVCAAHGGRQLVELCRAAPPDLVVADVRMADVDGIAAAAEVCRERPVPVVLLSGFHDPAQLARAAESDATAYLVKPIKQADLAAAIPLAFARFQQAQARRRESAELRQALEDRKLIERAKGAVCKRLAADENKAYRLMRKLSSARNLKLVEIARLVLAAEETFRSLEEEHAPAAGGCAAGWVGRNGGRAGAGDPTAARPAALTEDSPEGSFPEAPAAPGVPGAVPDGERP